jgi:membrane protease YdiL (CAAX protease family)
MRAAQNRTPKGALVNSSWSDKILGGFADAAPAPLASPRHLRRLIYITLGIAVTLVLQTRSGPAVSTGSRLPLYLCLIAVELALVRFVIIGIRARGYKLIDLFGERWGSASRVLVDLLLAVATVALLRYLGPLLYQFFGHWATTTGFLLPTTRAESVVWIAVSIAAGVCEETVYRGYLQRQLWSLTKSLWVALVLQAVIFGSAHIYQGRKPAVIAAIYGLIFGLVAAWRRSIIPGTIAHAITDVLGGLRM